MSVSISSIAIRNKPQCSEKIEPNENLDIGNHLFQEYMHKQLILSTFWVGFSFFSQKSSKSLMCADYSKFFAPSKSTVRMRANVGNQKSLEEYLLSVRSTNIVGSRGTSFRKYPSCLTFNNTSRTRYRHDLL